MALAAQDASSGHSIAGNASADDIKAAKELIAAGEQLLGVWRLSPEAVSLIHNSNVQCSPSAGKIDLMFVCCGLIPWDMYEPHHQILLGT